MDEADLRDAERLDGKLLRVTNTDFASDEVIALQGAGRNRVRLPGAQECRHRPGPSPAVRTHPRPCADLLPGAGAEPGDAPAPARQPARVVATPCTALLRQIQSHRVEINHKTVTGTGRLRPERGTCSRHSGSPKRPDTARCSDILADAESRASMTYGASCGTWGDTSCGPKPRQLISADSWARRGCAILANEPSEFPERFSEAGLAV